MLQLPEPLPELLELTGVDEQRVLRALKEGVVPGPDVDVKLLDGAAGGHDEFSVAVDFGVRVELRVNVLLPRDDSETDGPRWGPREGRFRGWGWER